MEWSRKGQPETTQKLLMMGTQSFKAGCGCYCARVFSNTSVAVLAFRLAFIFCVTGCIGYLAAIASSPAQAATRTPIEATRRFEKITNSGDIAEPTEVPSVVTSASDQPSTHEQTFELRSIAIDGAHSVSSDALTGSYRRYINRQVTPQDLSEIANSITAIYQQRGYSLSRAIIPEQDISDGRVNVAVLEGFIDDVVVKGEQAESYGAVRLLLPLTQQRPTRQQTLERQLLLLDATPGLRIVDTALEEIGQMTGRFRLIVTVETWSAYVNIGADNRGTRAVGRTQAYVSSSFNSVVAKGDSINFSASLVPTDPQELRHARLSYSAPVTNDGTRVGINAAYGQIQPGDDRRFYGNLTETTRIEFRGTVVPFRSPEASVWITLGGDVGDFRESNDGGLVSIDRVRALSQTMEAEFKDRLQGTNYFSLSLREGLPALGGSELGDAFLSRSDGSGRFIAAFLAYSRFQKLGEAWSIFFSSAAQLASDPLLASEEFYLGGGAFGRGYESGSVSGDEAAAASIELRFDQATDVPFLKGYQAYAFVDHGAVWDFRIGDTERFDLTSAGAGIRLSLLEDLHAEIEFASAIGESSSGSPDSSIYFSVSKALRLCPTAVTMRCKNSR